MDGNSPRRKRLDESPLVVALANQNGCRGRLIALGKLAHQPLCDRLGFIVESLLKDHLDGDATGLRCRLQDPHIGARQGRKWPRDLVGNIENIGAIAPARGERECRDGAPTKRGIKITEIGAASPAPSVDGLVRITHRHHRVAWEQNGEQRALSDAGVLILIE